MTIEDQTIVAPDDIGEIVRRLGSATQQLEGKRVLLAGGCGFFRPIFSGGIYAVKCGGSGAAGFRSGDG